MPSIVLTSCPSASRPNIKHERIERPFTRTAHVPHSPSSHPCLVPVRARSSRSTSSKVLCGAKATSAASPFKLKRMCAFSLFRLDIIQLRILAEEAANRSWTTQQKRERSDPGLRGNLTNRVGQQKQIR